MCDICDARAAGKSDAEAFAEYDQNTLDTIHLYGMALTGVTDAEPPFVYSSGRTLLDLPELFMAGYAPIQNWAGIINAVNHAQIDDGLHVHMGDRLEGFVDRGCKLAVVECDPVKAEMNATLSVFHNAPLEVRAWQLVWPDPEGRYPWDEGYDAERFVQPMYPVG